MNLAESMRHVLRTRSQSIFTDFWKDDLKTMLKEIGEDIWAVTQSGGSVLKKTQELGAKKSLKEFSEASIDTFKVIKIVPKRVKEGFAYFKDDFLKELDTLPDGKQKTVFTVKVLGVLSSSLLKTFYGVKKTKRDFSFNGIRTKNAFTRFLIAEIVFKISQVLILRVLNEVEKELSDPEEIKNIRFFRTVLSDSDKYEENKDLFPKDLENGDKAIELVDNLKKYISTGVRA